MAVPHLGGFQQILAAAEQTGFAGANGAPGVQQTKLLLGAMRRFQSRQEFLARSPRQPLAQPAANETSTEIAVHFLTGLNFFSQ